MRFTHNYATRVRLTITQWFKAHSYSYLSYYHEAHSQLCNGCEAHLQVHNGLRHTHSYLSYHHEAHSQYFRYDHEAHSQVCYACKA